jgi:hypothetical protein
LDPFAADSDKSFIFSLEPRAWRFDLLYPDKALRWAAGPGTGYLMFGEDLIVGDDGRCASRSNFYGGGRDDGSFPDSTGVRFKRFELWAL